MELRINLKCFIIFGVVLLGFLVASSSLLVTENRVSYSPDEKSISLYAQIFSSESNFEYYSPLNERYNTSIFRPRLSVENDKSLYSMSMPFIIVLFAFVEQFGVYASSIGYVLLVLSTLSLYNIISNTEGSKVLFVALLPPVMAFYSIKTDMIIFTSFYFLSLFYFLKDLKTHSSSNLFLGTLFLLVSGISRPSSGIIAMISILSVLFYHRSHYLRYLDRLTIFSLFLGLIGHVMSILVYKSIFFIPRLAQTMNNSTNPSKTARVPLDLTAIFNTVKVHIVDYSGVIFVAGFLGIFKLVNDKSKTKSALLISFGSFTSVNLLIYGSRTGVHLYGEQVIFSSMSRYFLPTYIFLAIFGAIFLFYEGNLLNKKMKVFLIFVMMVVFSVSLLGEGDNNLSVKIHHFQNLDDRKEEILTTPENSVFLTQTADKIILPERETGIVYTNRVLDKNPYYSKLYPIIDLDEDLYPIIKSLKTEGRNVFVYEDARYLRREINRTKTFSVNRFSKNIYEVKLK